MFGKYEPSRSQKGQGLSEYGIIAGVLLALAVPALLLFGNTLSVFMQDWNSQMAPKANSLAAGVAANKLISPAKVPLPSLALNGMQSITITTLQGNSITIDGYPAVLDDSISTLGANGATDYVAATLKRLAEELKSKGEINEASYNDLLKLANQGHRIAEIEKLMENAAAESNTSREYAAKRVLLDGKLLSMNVIEDMIGYRTVSTDPKLVSDPLKSTIGKAETGKFIELYQSYLKEHPTMDSGIQAVVENLSQQIAYLSEVSACAQIEVREGRLSPKELNEKMISNVTHLNSSHICTTGQNTDSGVQCSSP